MAADDSHLDLAALFDLLHRDRFERWQVVRSIAETFWGPILPEHQIDQFALDEAEARLGIEIPPALRKGCRLLGAHPNISAQNRLLHPREFTLHDPNLVRFRVENQGCADWACSIGEDDPPVYFRIPGGPWQPDAGSVAQFFVHMVLSEILLTAQFGDNGPADEDCIAQLESGAKQLAVPPFAFWPNPELPPRRFFGGPGVLIAEDARTWIWVAALTEELLDKTKRDIPGEWVAATSGREPAR